MTRRLRVVLASLLALVASAVPDLLMVVGWLTAMSGLYLLFGLGVALVVAGVTLFAYGAAHDVLPLLTSRGPR